MKRVYTSAYVKKLLTRIKNLKAENRMWRLRALRGETKKEKQ